MEKEKFLFLPNIPVISVPGFLLERFPGCHHLVIRKGYPIDPLQRFHCRIALPIRGGMLNSKQGLAKHIKHLVTNKTAQKCAQVALCTRGSGTHGWKSQMQGPADPCHFI